MWRKEYGNSPMKKNIVWNSETRPAEKSIYWPRRWRYVIWSGIEKPGQFCNTRTRNNWAKLRESSHATEETAIGGFRRRMTLRESDRSPSPRGSLIANWVSRKPQPYGRGSYRPFKRAISNPPGRREELTIEIRHWPATWEQL
jgi:hypothetical protein